MLIATLETSVRTTDNTIIFLAFISLGLIFVGVFVIPFEKLFNMVNRFFKTKINEDCDNNEEKYYTYVTIYMEPWLKVCKDNSIIKDVTDSYKLKDWQKRCKYKVWKLCIDKYVYIVEQITPISVSIGLDKFDKIYSNKAETINKWIIKNFKYDDTLAYTFPELYDSDTFAATCNSFTRMVNFMTEIEKVKYKKLLTSLGFKIF